ncbi:transcriptional regulator BetI [Cereibacter changlensis]|uniref:Transcriptional regulator BetI n=1 Tax=Cereibacter changlensis TaxID=402884 RepID=A0A4U0YVF6_9RHOB|nr:transcriptional regulator BetI [Cereibacter changlensis]TKA96720.1 transcriptional regulator BetI [Cereibacter changlensis]
MEHVRRRQIIAATKACIHRDGIVRASANRIAREAGIAPALITHYFDDKDALLVETFRSIYREFTTDIRRRLGLARTAQERMLSLLEVQISPSTLTPEAVTTWFSIYATMREYPVLERIEHAYDRRFLSNLTHALRGMGLEAGEARDVAEELSVFIDGLWQNLANPVTFSAERARGLLYRYLDRRLPGFAFAPPPDETAARTADDRGLSGEAKQFLKDNLPISPVRISSATIVELRAQLAQLYRPEAKAAAREFGLKLAQVRVGGVEALQIAPKSGAAVPASARVFYLFGGGYVTGDPESDLPISGRLAMRLGAAVLSPRYRLAPEHPFPAALEDGLAAYRGFVAETPAPFFLVGESAGGGLALALLQAARREGLRLPSAVALLSPWVDLTHGLPSANDGFDPTFTRRNLMESARLYAGAGADLADPRLSPLFGDLTGMPPVVITTGSRDILREQALALAEALTAAGTSVELHDWPGLWHVFEFYRALPEAGQSLDRVVAFLRHHSPSALEQAS